MYGLNINLQSFRFNPNLISPENYIRVSITTVPDDTKQSFIISASKIQSAHHSFSANITTKTRKIIFVFRKKNAFKNDPIIASVIVHSDEFPIPNAAQNIELKRFNLLEPLCQMKESGDKRSKEKRRIFGEMLIQMIPTDPFPVPLFDESYKKDYNSNCYSERIISHNSKKPVHVDENKNVVFNKNWVFN